MRTLSPNSQSIAMGCFQDRFSDQATTEAVNCLRGQDQYSTEEIQNFRKTNTLFLSQQITALESKRHSIENVAGEIDDQIKSLQNKLYHSLTQKISELQRQSFTLANMDGSVDRQIQNLQRQLQDLLALNSKPTALLSTSASSESMQLTQDSQHDQPSLHAPSMSRIGHPAFPTSLQSRLELTTGSSQPGNHHGKSQIASINIPSASSAIDRRSQRRRATDALIQNYLRNADGSLRTRTEIAVALHDDGFNAAFERIDEQMRKHTSPPSVSTASQMPPTDSRTQGQAANPESVGKPSRIRATDDQIRGYSRNADGSLRSSREIAAALHNDGFKAANERIRKQVKPNAVPSALGRQSQRTSATDQQILEYSRNEDGTVKTNEEVISALHADGLSAAKNRITTALIHLRGPVISSKYR